MRYDVGTEATSKNTAAGWTVFDQDGTDDRGGFVGWQGYGGSAMQFHPAERLGFGFAMNLLAPDLNNAAFSDGAYCHRELQMLVLEAATAIRANASSKTK